MIVRDLVLLSYFNFVDFWVVEIKRTWKFENDFIILLKTQREELNDQSIPDYGIQHCCIIFIPIILTQKQTPAINPHCGDDKKVKPWHIFPAIPGPGGPWLQTTGALAMC